MSNQPKLFCATEEMAEVIRQSYPGIDVIVSEGSISYDGWV